MDNKQLNKLIGQGFMVLIAYFILSFVIDYIVWGVVAMVALQFYQQYYRRK